MKALLEGATIALVWLLMVAGSLVFWWALVALVLPFLRFWA